MTIEQAARALVALWRNPDPDAWAYADEPAIQAAIEALCRAVEAEDCDV